MPGPTIAALDIADEPAAWAALGFAVDDYARCPIGQVELRLGAHGSGGIVGWTLRDAAGEGDVDGLPTARASEPEEAEAAPVHPNGARSVDHVVVFTPDADRTFAALTATGMELRRERAAGTPERPLRQGFFRHGEAIVEVVAPRTPEGDGPARFWGLVVIVDDLDAAAALLGDRLGAVKDAVQPGRRIATVRREAGLGIPVALMTPRQ
jgi:predicted RNA-binding protein with TRAM domain